MFCAAFSSLRNGNAVILKVIGYHDAVVHKLRCEAHCSAAVSSAYGYRRTMGVTAVVRAADGRRTMTVMMQDGDNAGKIVL